MPNLSFSGGAERLIVDAAIGLQDLGHAVTIYTSYFNKSHAFSECVDGRLKVRVFGDGLFPRNFSGRFTILCAILRQLHLVTTLIRTKEGESYDAFVVDQLSFCVPILRQYLPQARILFYGHFPDKYLADHSSLVKKMYRVPFDAIEQWSTGCADVIVVNSRFTQSMFRKAFPKIKSELGVVYPCVNTKGFESVEPSPFTPKSFVLSLNRFERKKNIDLVIKAFAAAAKSISEEEKEKSQVSPKLIVAGGYDFKVEENQQYMAELQTLCNSLHLSHATIWPNDGLSAYATPAIQSKSTAVIFVPSVSDNMKKSLLKDAALLAYTPTNEHFGIVPLEAMLAGTPTIACNTGGPLETITSETGWHRAPTPELWAPVIRHALFELSSEEKQRYVVNCKKRVMDRFSEIEMAHEFQKYLQIAVSTKRKQEYGFKLLEALLISLVVVFFLLLGVLFKNLVPR